MHCTDDEQPQLCQLLNRIQVFCSHQQQQMDSKKCNNNKQQHRRRRRRGSDCLEQCNQRRTQRHGQGQRQGLGALSWWPLSLLILICIAAQTQAVPTNSSSSISVAFTDTPTARDATSSAGNTAAAKGSGIINSSSSSTSGSGGGGSHSNSSSESALLEPQQPPQGQCLLDDVWVPETMVHCEKQTSCRAIQRTGHCCPDYKCDCEKDGKTYANGYKLVDPDTPCTVCYCKGGEIVCSSVTCFRRDDCMPKYVAGRCCPEYDNCPILENSPSLSPPDARESSGGLQSLTGSNGAAAPAQPAFNWNITIKEITKPTEIRITDDNKAKPAIPTRKPPVLPAAPPTEAPPNGDSTINPAAAAAAVVYTTAAPAAVRVDTTAAAATVSPTLSGDTNPKALPAAASGSGSSESLKLVASVSYTERPPAAANDTLPAELQPPLPTNDPTKVSIKREYTTEGLYEQSTTSRTGEEALQLGVGAAFVQNGFGEALLENVDVPADPETAGSDNIYHIISTTVGPSGGSSTETQLQGSSTTEQSWTTEQLINSSEATTAAAAAAAGAAGGSSTAQPPQHLDIDEDVAQVEANPAYPSLPEDDFSLRDVNFPLSEPEDIVEPETKDEQRSINAVAYEAHKQTKLQAEASNVDYSGSGSGDMELNTTVGQPKASITKVQLSKVPLMYSAEDSSAEMRIQNGSDFRRTENETSEELETLLGSGGGSGSGAIELPAQRQREFLTPRPTRASELLDIDDLGSGSAAQEGSGGAADPKADAESVKLDESQEHADDVSKTKTAEKAKARGTRHLTDRLYLQRVY